MIPIPSLRQSVASAAKVMGYSDVMLLHSGAVDEASLLWRTIQWTMMMGMKA